MDPLSFVKALALLYGKFPDQSKGCYKFMLLMLGLFPEGRGYYDDNHCLTKIGEYYYDHNGRYTIDDTVYLFVDGVPVGNKVRNFLSIDDVYGWDHMTKVFG